MGSKAQAESSSKRAAWMKLKGIIRRTGRCPICNHMVPLPMDKHFAGPSCAPRRKGIWDIRK